MGIFVVLAAGASPRPTLKIYYLLSIQYSLLFKTKRVDVGIDPYKS